MEAGYERVEEWNSLAGGTRSICPHAAFPCLCVCTCVRACVPFCARVLLGTAFLFPRSTAVMWGAAVAAPSQADEGNRLIVPVPLVGKQRPTAPQTNSPTKCPSRATGASTPKQPRRCRGAGGGGKRCLSRTPVVSSLSFHPPERWSLVRTGLQQNSAPLKLAACEEATCCRMNAAPNQCETFWTGLWKAALRMPGAELCCFKIYLEHPC